MHAHQSKAKYCLLIQGKKTKFICSICNKELCDKFNYDIHMENKHKLNIDNNELQSRYNDLLLELDILRKNNLSHVGEIQQLKERNIFLEKIISDQINDHQDKFSKIVNEYEGKFSKIINEYEEKLAFKSDFYEKILMHRSQELCDYQDKMEKITLKSISSLENIGLVGVNKPTICKINKANYINNLIMNMEPLTEECFEKNVCFLTDKHISNYIGGIVEYAVDYPMKDKVVCRDVSRNIFTYKNKDGSMTIDCGGEKIVSLLLNSIGDIIVEKYMDIHTKDFENINANVALKIISSVKNICGTDGINMINNMANKLSCKLVPKNINNNRIDNRR